MNWCCLNRKLTARGRRDYREESLTRARGCGLDRPPRAGGWPACDHAKQIASRLRAARSRKGSAPASTFVQQMPSQLIVQPVLRKSCLASAPQKLIKQVVGK